MVSGLERGEVLGAEVGVEVARLDARELGQVVNHLLLLNNKLEEICRCEVEYKYIWISLLV